MIILSVCARQYVGAQVNTKHSNHISSHLPPSNHLLEKKSLCHFPSPINTYNRTYLNVIAQAQALLTNWTGAAEAGLLSRGQRSCLPSSILDSYSYHCAENGSGLLMLNEV